MDEKREPKPLEEAVVDQVLEGQPRAREWREWRAALERRLGLLKRERRLLPPDADTSEADEQIREVEEQIAALSTEASITQFVEDAARFSLLAAARPVEDEEDLE